MKNMMNNAQTGDIYNTNPCHRKTSVSSSKDYPAPKMSLIRNKPRVERSHMFGSPGIQNPSRIRNQRGAKGHLSTIPYIRRGGRKRTEKGGGRCSLHSSHSGQLSAEASKVGLELFHRRDGTVSLRRRDRTARNRDRRVSLGKERLGRSFLLPNKFRMKFEASIPSVPHTTTMGADNVGRR